MKYQNHNITLYVGKSNKSTLMRAISEICGNAISTNAGKHQYSKLDTDFILSKGISYLVKIENIHCHWEHLDDNPETELDYCNKFQPILQSPNNGKLKSDLRIEKTNRYYDITKKSLKQKKETNIILKEATEAIEKK